MNATEMRDLGRRVLRARKLVDGIQLASSQLAGELQAIDTILGEQRPTLTTAEGRKRKPTPRDANQLHRLLDDFLASL